MMKIIKCTCAHAYQDKRLGPGMRYHNHAPKHGWRCTVCSDVKPAGKDEVGGKL